MLAALFFAACVACLLIGPHIHPMARAAGEIQIVLSSASATAGVSVTWLALTFLFGRVYCAAACPVGTFSDLFLRLRRKIPKLNKPFRYRPRSRWSVHILCVYILCVILGVAIVPFIVEPWNMARNIAAPVNPDTVAKTWATIGRGVATGAAAGLLSAIVIAILSLWRGREFCTRYCPIGTALGYAQQFSMLHIEIDPDKCSSCGKCEEICRAQCIKVSERYVDDQRCVRCFDCVAECPDDAIRYQVERNRPATPLFRKVKHPDAQ